MPSPFRIYNTLSRTVEDFEPLHEGKVGLYVCGMTVYDHAHVGHARAFVVFDAFVRYLRHRGWDVTYVRNYTDVDDKIIRRAQQEGVEPMAIAQRYIDEWQRDAAGLGLLTPDHEPRVSESIDEIIDMVKGLIDDGHAYASEGSVWFSVGSYDDYGHLSGQKPDEMRSSPDDGTKRDPRDFAVWKAAKPGEPSWPSPWGDGRPGWHIECSAMNRKHLGATVDIHGGGLDLVFPHHENEIAQSVCANHAPYARYWMHNGLITMSRKGAEGEVLAGKMGKSVGNVVNIGDALERYPAEALRLYYLQVHYRSPLPWNDDALPDALAMLARLYEAREVAQAMGGEGDADTVAEQLGADAQTVLSLARGFEERFYAALDDDLNTSSALGHAFELARAINRLSNHKKAAKRAGPVVAPALDTLAHLEILGLLTMSTEAFQDEVKRKVLRTRGLEPAAIDAKLTARDEARASKDWATADAIRDELEALGVVVMDRPGGAEWRVRLTGGDED